MVIKPVVPFFNLIAITKLNYFCTLYPFLKITKTLKAIFLNNIFTNMINITECKMTGRAKDLNTVFVGLLIPFSLIQQSTYNSLPLIIGISVEPLVLSQSGCLLADV